VERLGIHLAEARGSTSLRLSLKRGKRTQGGGKIVMGKLRKILLAVLAGALISGCTFAQKGGNDNRPPKDNPKVVDKDKQKPPPSQDNNNRRKP